jgi:hypothetical protein
LGTEHLRLGKYIAKATHRLTPHAGSPPLFKSTDQIAASLHSKNMIRLQNETKMLTLPEASPEIAGEVVEKNCSIVAKSISSKTSMKTSPETSPKTSPETSQETW